jgi:hypothetical protein
MKSRSLARSQPDGLPHVGQRRSEDRHTPPRKGVYDADHSDDDLCRHLRQFTAAGWWPLTAERGEATFSSGRFRPCLRTPLDGNGGDVNRADAFARGSSGRPSASAIGARSDAQSRPIFYSLSRRRCYARHGVDRPASRHGGAARIWEGSRYGRIRNLGRNELETPARARQSCRRSAARDGSAPLSRPRSVLLRGHRSPLHLLPDQRTLQSARARAGRSRPRQARYGRVSLQQSRGIAGNPLCARQGWARRHSLELSAGARRDRRADERDGRQGDAVRDPLRRRR